MHKLHLPPSSGKLVNPFSWVSMSSSLLSWVLCCGWHWSTKWSVFFCPTNYSQILAQRLTNYEKLSPSLALSHQLLKLSPFILIYILPCGITSLPSCTSCFFSVSPDFSAFLLWLFFPECSLSLEVPPKLFLATSHSVFLLHQSEQYTFTWYMNISQHTCAFLCMYVCSYTCVWSLHVNVLVWGGPRGPSLSFFKSHPRCFLR